MNRGMSVRGGLDLGGFLYKKGIPMVMWIYTYDVKGFPESAVDCRHRDNINVVHMAILSVMTWND